MNPTNALVLAAVQSITEFLPISSSAHLVIARRLLGIGEVSVLFDLVLHLGTVSATVLVYRVAVGEVIGDTCRFIAGGRHARDALAPRGNVKLAALLILSTALTGAVGLAFHDTFATFFRERSNYVPLLLVATGLILLSTRFLKAGEKRTEEVGPSFALLLGVAQAVAILPGISRSGTTISAGLFLGANRSFAALYSFLLSIPSVLGASVGELALEGTSSGYGEPWTTYLIAYLAAFVSGYGALKLLLGFLRKGALHLFSIYCIAGGVVWYVAMARGII